MKTETMWYIAIMEMPDTWSIEVIPFEENIEHVIRTPSGMILFDRTPYKTKKRALLALIRYLGKEFDKNRCELGEILLKEHEHLLNDPERNYYQSILLEQEREKREMDEKWLKERGKE